MADRKRNGSYKNSKNGKAGGGRNYNRDKKGKNSQDARLERDDRAPSTNHDSWWNPDDNLFNLATRIPFGFRTGDPIPVFDGKFVSPGVVAIDYVPTWGELKDKDSIANVCAQYLVSAMRTKNKGTPLVYDQSNVLAYCLALDSIAQGVCFVQRILTMAQVYTAKNKYFPEVLINASGVNYNTSLINNLANHVFRLNLIIQKLNTFYVPDFLPVFERHAQMCLNMYLDEANMNAQVFLFRPAYIYKYGYTKEGLVQLTPLQFVPDVSTSDVRSWNIDKYLMMLEECLASLFGDVEDIVTISGNMEATFGSGHKLDFATFLPKQGPELKVNDVDMLHQIHNLYCVKHWIPTPIVETIETDDAQNIIRGYLTGDITASMGTELTNNEKRMYMGNRPLDIHGDASDSNLIMKCTRLMTGTIDVSTPPTAKLRDYGTEVVNNISVWFFKDGVPNWIDSFSCYPEQSPDYNLISKLYNVSYAPIISMWQEVGQYPLLFGNTDQLTAITVDDITQLNKVAMMGAFSIGKLDFIE